MTTFFALLTAYYLCDATASQRLLTRSEVATCATYYADVKAEFRDPGASGPAAEREAYRRFKAWEAAHPDTVRRLKANAAAQLTETTT
ncbi:MAG: hypothetical protein AAFR47_16315 [Pseudomonadota bacterium]